MIYLFLSIISSTFIFITFKISEKFNVSLLHLITINYLVASILGFSTNNSRLPITDILKSEWLIFSALIGTLFIIMFFLIGYSTRKSGVAITTIAGKMSLVIPVIFSLFYFNEEISLLKILGLLLATIGVVLAIYKPLKRQTNVFLIALPFLIFIGSGLTDSVVKYTQEYFITDNIALLFSSFVFLTALILGITSLLLINFKRSLKFTFSEIISGIILGLANFGSLYFFILALEKSKIDSSIIFGLNNISIVILSGLIGSIIFKENLSKINFAGIILSVFAILILMNI